MTFEKKKNMKEEEKKKRRRERKKQMNDEEVDQAIKDVSKQLNSLVGTVLETTDNVVTLSNSFNQNIRFLIAWDRFLHPNIEQRRGSESS